MASLASLVSLGAVCTSSSDGTLSIVRRVSFSRVSLGRRKRWRVSVCKYSVTTDFIAQQGNADTVSLDSTYRSSKDEDADLLLKPAPKPVLKPVNSVGPVAPWEAPRRPTVDSDDEKKKVIESLGEVLEKAEQLETSRPGELRSKNDTSFVNKPASLSPVTGQRPNANGSTAEPVNSAANKKTKTLKSVWRKGNPVANAQKVIKDLPKTDNSKIEQEKPKHEVRAEVEAPPKDTQRPLQPPARPIPVQPPMRPPPMLQTRPSATPPPMVKKSVILKDEGATPRSTDATKERKPILIDKFASKKNVVDPLIAQAVLAPPKPGKMPPPTKFKEDYRKKNASSGAPRRRKVNDEVDEEETAELNVSIPGSATARKGRKWTKASRKAARLQAARDAAPVKVEIIEVDEEGMLIEDLAFCLATSEGEILGYLYAKGIKPDGVQKVGKDMVKMICKEYEVEVIDADPVRVEEKAKKKEILDEDDLDKLQPRPPVVTIMGHVDHGKTTLLDFIRTSKVTASEAGGITQGIGAYKVLVPVDGKPQPCVFLDTPGHEAFGAMRARGARVTDIAIIVVAADDGIRPQTNEAIAHAKAAGVPMIIAINKIDKDGANPERVMQELSSVGLMPEDWGGDIPMVQVSALKGQNVGDLLETVMLVAELQDLKANPQRNAKGTVIEAGLHKSKGSVATFIVQNGTLKRGDVVVCGEAFGKVRALFDDDGKRIDVAGPSIPVQVIGLNNVPIAGDEFEVVDSLDIAREKAEMCAVSIRNERLTAKAGDGKVTLSSLASAVSAGKLTGIDLHQLNIIMKVDVQGTIEAVRQALQVLPQDNVTLKFLLQATGDVSNSDVDLAVASEAIILGFNIKVPGSVKSHAENKGVEIRLYRVIYDLIDDMRNAMEGLLDPVEEQVPIGTAEVRAVFSSGSGRVAGCMITEGKVVKGCGIHVVRNRKTVHTGNLDSLRRVKETVQEVNAGLECGIGADDYDDWQDGDIIEAFNSVQKKRTLEEASASMAAALEGAGIGL